VLRWGALHWQGGFMVECSQAKFLSQLLFNSSRKPQGVSRCLKIGFVWLCMAVWVDVGCVNLFEIEVLCYFLGEPLGIHSLSLQLQWK
jgi:hypothetical protein